MKKKASNNVAITGVPSPQLMPSKDKLPANLKDWNKEICAGVCLWEAREGDNPEAALYLCNVALDFLHSLDNLTLPDQAGITWLIDGLQRIAEGEDAGKALGLIPAHGRKRRTLNINENTRLRDWLLQHEVERLLRDNPDMRPYQSTNSGDRGACAIIALKYDLDIRVVEEAYKPSKKRTRKK